MQEVLQDLLPLGQLTGTGAILLVAWLVITRKLVWHNDLEKVEKEKDEWKKMTLDLLGATEKLTTSAELSTEIISRADSQATSTLERQD